MPLLPLCAPHPPPPPPPSLQVHLAYEQHFWSTKMHLTGASADELSRSKTDLDKFLADPSCLAAVRGALAEQGVSPEQRHVLSIMVSR